MEPLVAAGAALALSFAGRFVSSRRQRSRPQLLALPPPPSQLSGFTDGLGILAMEEASVSVLHGTSIAGVHPLPPFCRSLDDDFPPVAEIEEFEDGDNTRAIVPVGYQHSVGYEQLETKDLGAEREITRLHSLAHSLLERERNLELEMLEYYGVKEQEAAMKELENQLKVNTVEAKFLALKVESLEEENCKLKAQLSELEGTKVMLDSTRAKIKVLKRRLQSEGDQAQAMMVALRERITVLLEKEHVDATDDAEIQSKLARLEQLEGEATDLRRLNLRLASENSELAQRARSAQMAAEEEDEASHLREENAKLTEEIERLRNNHCADVEELVYLRWLNACLRYELRSYQPPAGHKIARDLNKTLSIKSEEKVKQLILEYSNLGIDMSTTDPLPLPGPDSFCFWSPPTPPGREPHDSPWTPGKAPKPKFLGKIKKFVLGKGHHKKNAGTGDRTPPPWSPGLYSDHNMHGRRSFDSISSTASSGHTPASSVTTAELHTNEQMDNRCPEAEERPRSSFGVHGARMIALERARSRSDLGSGPGRREPERYHCLRLERAGSAEPPDSDDHSVPEKAELKKFAEVLKSSHETREPDGVPGINHT